MQALYTRRSGLASNPAVVNEIDLDHHKPADSVILDLPAIDYGS